MPSKVIVTAEPVLNMKFFASKVAPDGSSYKGNADYDQYDDECNSSTISALVLLEVKPV
jgi:hypothetical protein